jgi:cytochrome bd-type quinol oxidase subunit 2
MKAFALSFLFLTGVAIVLWWPVADRYVQGPRLITHGLLPAVFALIAVLAWKAVRSLAVAVLCAAAIALVVFLVYRHFGETLRPLLERLAP